ncbi:TPA: DNA sulfur modification protein DndB [Burkholderia cenocepacia]|nr:DNA sulfur modification protein DndB [Burkholderia cenocepacia]
MAHKYYVMALQQAFVPGAAIVEAGAIVSSHAESYKANERARNLNRRGDFSVRRPAFGVLEHDGALNKGDVYPDLLAKYLSDKFDAEAIHAMKGVLDPYWASAKPVTEEMTAWALEDLGLTLPDLRERYEIRARRELDQAQSNRIANAERTARVEAVRNQLTTERSEFTYTFPAVAGVQAGRAYYAAQVPYGALVKLFVFDEEEVVPAHLRAQRVLNKRRAEDISVYMTENRSDYVLPAITASVSAEMSFEPIAVSGAANRIGLLHIPMDALMLINDGQHRRAGIELAIAANPSMREETVTVVIFFDQGLERSQQMFADINGKQVKPSSAINALYDRRDPFNAWALSIMSMLPGIGARVDVENSSVPAKSYKLWSLIVFKKFLTILTGISVKNITELGDKQLHEIDEFLLTFFEECGKHIPKWAQMIAGDIPAFDIREQFVIGHAVWLEALAAFARRAMFTGYIMDHGRTEEGVIRPDIAKWDVLKSLSKVDPRRESLMWENRCVVLGKMQKTSDGVKSTAAKLLYLAGVALPADMKALDQRIHADFEANRLTA